MNQSPEQEPSQPGTLYQAAREELTGPTPTPEDLQTADELLAQEAERLKQEYGEVEGLIKHEEKLFELLRGNHEKIVELLRQRKI